MNEWIGKDVSFTPNPIPKEEPMIRGEHVTYKGRLMKVSEKTPVFGLPAHECEVRGMSGKTVRVCSISQYLRLCEDKPEKRMKNKQFKEWVKDDREDSD